jgi:hypothetical protein
MDGERVGLLMAVCPTERATVLVRVSHWKQSLKSKGVFYRQGQDGGGLQEILETPEIWREHYTLHVVRGAWQWAE